MKKLYFLFSLVSISAAAQVINFPDANFKTRLLQSSPSSTIAKNALAQNIAIDANGDNEITQQEALVVYQLDVDWEGGASPTIANLSGLEYFTNLRRFSCNTNDITAVNLTTLVNLEHLECEDNNLTSLNLSPVPNLVTLRCSLNYLATIDLTPCPLLQSVFAVGTHSTSINTTGLTQLGTLVCRWNQLFTSIDLSTNVSLQTLVIDNTPLTVLDVSHQPNLFSIAVSGPNLQAIYMKNGYNGDSLQLLNSPNLEYICADEGQITTLAQMLDNATWSSDIVVNSYCTFVPGGDYYVIKGNCRYDNENDGCDASDVSIEKMRYNISNGTTSFSCFATGIEEFQLPVVAGSYTVTPVLQFEHQSYFTMSPATINASFPAMPSPHVQDICVTANGLHNDVEVTIIPLLGAVPGASPTYKIVYENNGTVTKSGSVTLAFEDDKSDFVSATPLPGSQSVGFLSWDYADLAPFERRIIEVVLHLNTPTDTPPLEAGDTFNLGAQINPVSGDETPADNIFGLKQNVANSHDPNDKTCMEGSVVGPEVIGKYVHYVIRFENTGTANAQNIVVKDVIDTTKFDMGTFYPVDGSAAFTTRVTNGNTVEFVLENINLPFDDANNDGYVAFKIKTKPSLVVGDTFSNAASIYFDYNSPIVTNTATTTIQLLGTPDFEFSDAFTVYPNPAKNVLNIQSKNGVEVESVSIYNLLGQLVQVETGAISAIDISKLQTGQYFVKVHSEKGNAVTKFIKQ